METITVNIPKQKITKLKELAIHYGLSIENLASRILAGVSANIGEESWDEYNPATKMSFKKGLADFRAGRVSQTL